MGTTARRAERGFTLLEIMVVCVIILILAVVVIPFFFGESRKSKGKTEVTAFFGEMSTKEEQFKVDNGQYFPLGGGATNPCPGSTNGQGSSAINACPTVAPPGGWLGLRVLPPTSTAICDYTITSGVTGGAAPAPPTGFAMTAQGGGVPVADWYFLVATCDLDGQGPPNSTYFTSSLDSSIQIQNEGR